MKLMTKWVQMLVLAVLVAAIALPASVSAQTMAIAQAKSLVGQTVTVEGVVTADNAAIGGGRLSTFIQDATAGINVFAFDASGYPNLEEGDRVQVTGVIELYQGLTEIQPSSPNDVQVISTGNALPMPVMISAADLNNAAFVEQYEGSLVALSDRVYIENLPSSPAGGGYNVTAYDEDYNAVTLRIMEDTGLYVQLQENMWYDVNEAVLGQYFSYQLMPRNAGDLTISSVQGPGPEPVDTTPIANARQMTGQTVTVEGVISADNAAIGGGRISTFIQDDTAGINLFAYNASGYPNLEEGDRVRVTGTISIYNGLTEIVPSAPSDVEVLSKGSFPYTAVTRTIPQLSSAATAEPLEGQLVHTQKVQILSLPTTPAGGGYNITIQYENGATMLLRVMEDTGIYEQLAVNTWYDITGVLSQYYDYQLVPRSWSDIQLSN